ncbi:hypothetical protein BMR85_007330 [Achromobacter sp. KAs 3-5]|nr:hypothetical protein BMR85_007330 [Achromobacter sp. KAs 3-5]
MSRARNDDAYALYGLVIGHVGRPFQPRSFKLFLGHALYGLHDMFQSFAYCLLGVASGIVVDGFSTNAIVSYASEHIPRDRRKRREFHRGGHGKLHGRVSISSGPTYSRKYPGLPGGLTA